jgi:hypothetical protein
MAVRRRAMEYRSEQVWGNLPMVHVSVGGRQADGRYRLGRARGIIALGDVATGLVAIGLFSVGGVAVGLVALGAVAIGLVAVGAVAIGLFAAGAVAIGLTAVGAVTAGLVLGPRPLGGIAPSGKPRAEDGRPGDVDAAGLQAPMERGPEQTGEGGCWRVTEIAGRSGPWGGVDRGGRRGRSRR